MSQESFSQSPCKERICLRSMMNDQFSFKEDSMSDDDIDRIFSHLEQLEPPPETIARVMNAVSRLPLPQYISSPLFEEGEEYPLVRNLRPIPAS
jgi:hypothetical protein